MAGNGVKAGGGWEVGRFIAIEIDVALSIASGYFVVMGGDEEYGGLVAPIAGDWRADAREILGPEPRLVSLLEIATACAGTTFEADYARALLPLRSLDPAGALAALRAPGISAASGPSESVPPRDAVVAELADELAARYVEAYRVVGLTLDLHAPQTESLRSEVRRLGRVLAGGDLHDRFWPWLDRFFYEWYQPWRRGREQGMAEAQSQAVMALGGERAETGSPSFDWLPPQNPIRMLPELKAGIVDRGIRLYFWVEPFGLADSSMIFTGRVCVSFGKPGRIYAQFRKHADAVAQRAKALGDPTRLLILRLIRHFPMMNTELAEYLEIARPTASIHAKILREAGLITSRQDGHAVRHEIDRESIRRLFDDLYRFLDLGAPEGGPPAGGDR
ncbi:MAG TPA: metalloregulator ArsR/SmtB family transcription factor [Spirochaetia bacterium]|nr:metalloregulator ArsR/SmtB family transcription factor [Spirochaetia bacterium]